ncbi:dihydrofolate reductase family protein [Pacificispira sp.]|uniref:dihydrofolate reductase family protein n=1 Tax=Pacificispira sp. TaxID=2888761 RepID=UPI003B52DC3A
MPAKITVTQYISLDGVIEDPVGMENSGLGDWTGPYSRGPEGDRFKHEELMNADAMIYGRRTYDGFAAVWPTIDNEFADRMNALPKYLASTTVGAPGWQNMSLLAPDLIPAVEALRARLDGTILIYGSASICHTLFRAGLIDAVTLMIYPVALGRGICLFPNETPCRLSLTHSQTFDDGIQLLQYETAR